MSRRLVTLVALELALCSACGGESPSEHSDANSHDWRESGALFVRGANAVLAPESVTNCPDSGTQPASTPLWIQAYEESPEPSALAADSRGNLLLARSGSETEQLGCAGEVRWSVPFGARVAVDTDDNVYVAGAGSDGGASVMKLDGDGGVVYSATLGAEVSGDIVSLSVDTSQNVALSGPTLGTWKLDANGTPLWHQPFNGQLAFDSQGNLWLTGALEGSQTFGATTLVSQGGSDVLLLKLGPDGAPLLAQSFGDIGALQRGEAISVDREDHVLVAGIFNGSIDFGTGSLESRPASCSSDAWCASSGFLAKLDTQGGPLFGISLGLTRAVGGVAADQLGNIALSSALPGGVRPFRQSKLSLLSPAGEALWQRSEWPDTGVGAGHSVVFNADGDVVWHVSARPSFEEEEHSYVAKLAH